MENRITKEMIDRINVLAKKSKGEGLTEEEKQEQQVLRKQYIEAFKANFRQQLEIIEFVDNTNDKVETKDNLN